MEEGQLVGLDDVQRAREVVAPHIQRTPLLSSRHLGERIGAQAWLKAESLQRTGSFKPRGAVYAVATMPEADRQRGIVTMSAGNAAQAIAYAGRAVGARVVVAMPETAPATKVAATRGYGAEVRFGADTTKLMPIVRELEAAGMRFLHPFDDDAMIAGHGTVAVEILEDLPDVDLIVVPVGGGGLIAGIAVAATALRPGIRVVGVEPEGAPGMRRALDAGRVVPLERPRTIADALAAPFAGERPLEIVRGLVEDVVLVSDDEIAEGVRFLAARARLVVEPGGAAAVAALLAGRAGVRPGERVAVLVSGGNVDAARLAEILGADGPALSSTPGGPGPRPQGADRPRATLYADGAARGNPGPAGAGALLLDERGDTLAELHLALGRATNNVAEYQALILGLEEAKKRGIERIDVRMDSLLVVRQMQGLWKIKHPGLRPLAVRAGALLAEFGDRTIEHVPREQNSGADRLANKAIDEAGG